MPRTRRRSRAGRSRGAPRQARSPSMRPGCLETGGSETWRAIHGSGFRRRVACNTPMQSVDPGRVHRLSCLGQEFCHRLQRRSDCAVSAVCGNVHASFCRQSRSLPRFPRHRYLCGRSPPPPQLVPAMAEPALMEKLVSLCKRRGFVFQSSEIYGGLGSVWDYGPLGVELKKNIKERWWRAMVHARDDIEGLDAAILMHPRVWEAAGHVAGFTDPLVDCKHCKNRFRADDPRIKGTPGRPDAQCPVCGSRGTLTAPRLFN